MLLTDSQIAAVEKLTATFKAQQNREAAKIAATIALYYQTRVDPESSGSVARWIELMTPKLIRSSDDSATRAAKFFDAIRRIELGPDAPSFKAAPSLRAIDSGVSKSLLVVGPYDYMNKRREISALDGITPQQQRALLADAKGVTTGKVAAAAVRHAQAGARQTIYDNSLLDEVALGWIRVTRPDPCHFCAMLASRGISYRPFTEGAFEESNLRFTGEGDAKVHDSCGCSMKPVYSKNDPSVEKTKPFADMWSMWGAGGGDAAGRFRRGYDHFRKTGEYLTHEQAAAA